VYERFAAATPNWYPNFGVAPENTNPERLVQVQLKNGEMLERRINNFNWELSEDTERNIIRWRPL
jgi:hypothetical protein